MADFVRVTIIRTPDTHPGHDQPFLTWINLALVDQRQPARDEDHPRARTQLIDVHGRSLSVREPVEEIPQDAPRGTSADGRQVP
jgi:hypothetical protein